MSSSPAPSCPDQDVMPLCRTDVLAALALAAVLAVTAGARLYVEACGQCHDDAIYLATAKALAEGDGYRQTFLPGAPPQTKYPPLYPILLAGLWRLWPDFPANLLLLKGFTLLCGSAFLAISYLFLVRFRIAERRIVLAAGLLCATSVMFLFFATLILSEMLFGLLLVCALWWVESAARRPPGRATGDFFGGMLLALPYLCRSVGIVLIPLALLRLRQAGQRWRWAALGAGVAVLPWLLWSTGAWRSWEKDPVEGYYTDYLGWWFSFGPPAFARVVTYNVRWIVTGSSLGLDGTSELLKRGGDTVWVPFFGVLGLVVLAGLLIDVRKGRLLGTCLAAYLVLISVWPWAPHRFLIPLLPFLLVYLLRGLDAVVCRLGSRQLAAGLGGALLGAALVLNVAGWVLVVRARHLQDTSNPELGKDAHAWSGNRRLFDWLMAHTDPDDVIAAGSDPMIALYTGRRAYYPIVCPPLSLFYDLPGPKDAIMDAALAGLARRRPRYLVLTPNFHGEKEFRAWVADLRQRFPGQVVSIYRDPVDERFEVFELSGDLLRDVGSANGRGTAR